MKISYDDLMNKNSLPFKMLEQLETERKMLEKRADRLRQLDNALVQLIQDGRITDTEQMDAVIAWLNYSNLEVWEIINKILDEP